MYSIDYSIPDPHQMISYLSARISILERELEVLNSLISSKTTSQLSYEVMQKHHDKMSEKILFMQIITIIHDLLE